MKLWNRGVQMAVNASAAAAPDFSGDEAQGFGGLATSLRGEVGKQRSQKKFTSAAQTGSRAEGGAQVGLDGRLGSSFAARQARQSSRKTERNQLHEGMEAEEQCSLIEGAAQADNPGGLGFSGERDFKGPQGQAFMAVSIGRGGVVAI